MKLLIVGSDKIYSIENHFVKHFRERGIDIIRFSSQNMFYEYYQKNFFRKLIFRLGLAGIYSTINNSLKDNVSETRPDILWVFKGMEIFPETLLWIKKRNVKIVNYNPDNPFLFSGRGSGNRNITDSIGLYDLHFTYNLTVKARLENQYNLKVSFLPFAFELDTALFQQMQAEEEICKVCFLGNPDSGRAEFLTSIANQGLAIDVYGHHWNKFVNNPFIKIHDAVYGENQWRILRKYRVQLNLMRPHNEDSHNMRTFEVPAIGGIMVAPDTPEHRLFFEHGKEVFLFKDVAECSVILKKLLLLPADEALEIRNAARRRSLHSGYDYKSQAAGALKEMEGLLRE